MRCTLAAIPLFQKPRKHGQKVLDSCWTVKKSGGPLAELEVVKTNGCYRKAAGKSLPAAALQFKLNFS